MKNQTPLTKFSDNLARTTLLWYREQVKIEYSMKDIFNQLVR